MSAFIIGGRRCLFTQVEIGEDKMEAKKVNRYDEAAHEKTHKDN
jgi:hypothetical protein